MPPAANPDQAAENQVKFLVTCIKFTNGGRPDFAKVAEELEIVSKQAAAKRFERLLAKNGVTLSALNAANTANAAAGEGSATPTKAVATPKKKRAAPTTPGSLKKRKTAAKSKKSSDEEDGEEEASADILALDKADDAEMVDETEV